MSDDTPRSAMEALERIRAPRPETPTPSPNGVKEEHELTDRERFGVFSMYIRPDLYLMSDIRKRWLITEMTAHYVYDLLESQIRSLRRRGVVPGKLLGGDK